MLACQLNKAYILIYYIPINQYGLSQELYQNVMIKWSDFLQRKKKFWVHFMSFHKSCIIISFTDEISVSPYLRFVSFPFLQPSRATVLDRVYHM